MPVPNYAAVVVGIFATGCTGPSVRFVDLPPIDGAAAVVIGVRSEGDVRVATFDLGAGRDELVLPFRLGSDAPIDFEALVYAESLDVLRLPDGELRRPEPGEPHRALPETKAVYGSSVSGEDRTSWAQRAEPELTAGFQFAPETPCNAFELTELPLDFVQTSSLASADEGLLLASDHVLVTVTSSADRLAIFEQEGGHVLSGCNDRLAGGVPVGSDRFWFGAPDELLLVQIDEASLSCSVERRVVVPNDGKRSLVRWLAGGVRAGRTDIFILNDRGSFAYFDGETVTELARVEPNPKESFPDGSNADGGIVSTADGGFLGVYGGTNRVYRGDKTGLTKTYEIPLPDFDPRVFSIARLSDSRFVVGTGIGQVFGKDGDGVWELVADLSDQASAIAPVDDGWIAVAGRELVEYYDGFGVCPPFSVANATRKARRIVTTGAYAHVIPDWIGNRGTRPAAVAWLRRR